MKHLKKKFLSSLFVMVLMVSSVTAYASVIHAPRPTPRWSYIDMMTANMEVDDRNAAEISVTCNSSIFEVDKITAKCQLQQLDGSWKTIKSWSETENNNSIDYTKKYAIAKNYSYRLKVTATVYKDSKQLETATEYFDYGYYN